jgi:shikimate kinase
MKIYLIGLPGSGKTTLGKSLAVHLRYRFIDLDREIVTQENKTIPEIFSTSGETYFREVESALLKKWAVSPDPFVMGTGGGAPCFHNGIDIINSSGTSVFLHAPLNALVDRLKLKTDRPLLTLDGPEELLNKLKSLEEKRISIYQKAHIIVDDPDLEKVLTALDLKK